MSSVVINGDTSGSITLQAPAVAGTNTLTLPANTGTVLTSASSASDLPSSIKGPAFSAYPSVTQTMTYAVSTKIACNTEEFDTNSNYDTSNYRFTPTVAGYYQVTCCLYVSALGTYQANIYLYKNGSNFKYLNGSTTQSGGDGVIGGTCLIYLNGSTDYIEFYAIQFSGSSKTTGNGSTSPFFQAVMVRGA